MSYAQSWQSLSLRSQRTDWQLVRIDDIRQMAMLLGEGPRRYDAHLEHEAEDVAHQAEPEARAHGFGCAFL